MPKEVTKSPSCLIEKNLLSLRLAGTVGAGDYVRSLFSLLELSMTRS